MNMISIRQFAEMNGLSTILLMVRAKAIPLRLPTENLNRDTLLPYKEVVRWHKSISFCNDNRKLLA